MNAPKYIRKTSLSLQYLSASRSSLLFPAGFDLGRMQQSLHDDTILLCLSLQCGQLFRARFRCAYIEKNTDTLEPDRRFLGDAQCALQIKITLNRNFDAFCFDPHRRRYHLTRDLGAGCQSAQQQISRASARACSADSLVSLGVVNGTSQVDRAGDWGAGFGAAGR